MNEKSEFAAITREIEIAVICCRLSTSLF